MNKFLAAGGIILVLGLITFVIPDFTTHQTTEVAKIGDLKLQTTENTDHVIPPMASGIVVAVGVILMLAGLKQQRG
jgi:uncharacterized protein YjeT (DUF2065 family)